MIINTIIKEMWFEESQRFHDMYDAYMKLSEDELTHKLLDSLDISRIVIHDSPFSRMTMIPTTGCPHWHCKDSFSGCSFCDSFSYNLEELACLTVLKDKNLNTYYNTVQRMLDKTRKMGEGSRVVEHITAYDSLCESEIDFDNLLAIYRLMNKYDDMTYLALETRAYHVNEHKLRKLKQICKRIMLECAMEVGDEWLRNHWLNKGITDLQLKNAIDIIHQEGCISYIDVLLGVPGLNSLQSKQQFIDTCTKAFRLGADYLVVSPLLRKKNNLSGALYKHFRNDPQLCNIGATCAEYTGYSNILTVYEALLELLSAHPEYEKKLILSPLHFGAYLHDLPELYVNSPYEETVHILLESLIQYLTQKNIDILQQSYSTIQGTPFETSYRQAQRIYKHFDISSTLLTVFRKLAQFYQEKTSDVFVKQFMDELKLRQARPL